jgi:phosphotransferase system  glucose/maltose/N-acetylglucosamine-specific IIC component
MRVRLFVLACFLGGVGGLVGSILGGAFGQRGLFIGGFAGGVLVAPLTAMVARWRRWIVPSQFVGTALGAAIGFVCAATVAVNTLSSPVGPVLSTLLIGAGAVVGSRLRKS